MEVKHGEREIQIWLSMKTIGSSIPNDFGYNKRIDGQIMLKEIFKKLVLNDHLLKKDDPLHSST